ncbi:MAG: hypothetical protein JXQ29_00120 [Planctomycetes bacterium]|nr:hypothetical protein [Planctomycetota bacterium]
MPLTPGASGSDPAEAVRASRRSGCPPTERWILWALVAVFVGLGLVYALVTPVMHAPDENDHLMYVFYLHQFPTLPTISPPGGDGIGQGHQPPLYYLLLLAVYELFGPPVDAPGALETTYRLLRVTSLLLLGVPFVLLTGLLCRQLTPGDGAVQLLTLAAASLLPMFLHLAASLANGVMASALCAALLVAAVSAMRAPSLPLYRHYVHGILLGLALVAKLTAAPVVAVCGAVLLWAAWRSRRRPAAVLAVTGTALLVCGPWFLRCWMVYGDPLTVSAFMDSFRRLPPDLPRGLQLHHALPLWQHVIGVFGFRQDRMFPDWVYWSTLVICLGAFMCGPVLARLRGLRLAPLPARTSWLLGAAVAATLLFFYLSQRSLVNLQIRYAFVVLPVLAFGFARGALAPWRGQARRIVAAALSLLMLGLAVWGAFLVGAPPGAA